MTLENKIYWTKILFKILYNYSCFVIIQMYLFGLLHAYIYKHYIYFVMGVSALFLFPITYVIMFCIKDYENNFKWLSKGFGVKMKLTDVILLIIFVMCCAIVFITFGEGIVSAYKNDGVRFWLYILAAPVGIFVYKIMERLKSFSSWW